jgi:hypothetical protein
VSNLNPCRLALSLLVVTLAAAACGGSTGSTLPPVASAPPATLPGSAAPTGAALPSISATSASPSCPTGAVVGGALGLTLPAPTGVAGGGAVALPPAAIGIVCEYHATSANVIIEVLAGIDPSIISKFSTNFPVAYKSAPGVGDQARTFLQSLGGGRDNEGVVATKGSTLVAITATATPASLTQVEALVSQLL